MSEGGSPTHGSLEATLATGGRSIALGEDLEQGQRIGRYLVLSRLGAGAMGTVYAAYDPELDRKVAIKLVRVRAGRSGESWRARLLREAQALARITHPNVVTVHDVGTHDEQVYVAMEFLDGETLKAWSRGGERSWSEVVERFGQAGLGLAAAHEEKLVHRDFKPENVMVVAKTGRVVVLDFGLARGGEVEQGSPVDATSEQSIEGSGTAHLSVDITRAGELTGTPAYMSPEQFRGAKVDARSDQFGFCVALYEALYGERPFVGDSPAALAFAVSEGKVREPAANDRGVPAWLRRVVVRGLSTDPEKRWPSMRALLEALHPPSRRTAGLGVGLALLAGVGAASFAFLGGDGDELCTGARAELAGVWDPARAAQVEEHLAGLELDWLDEGWPGMRTRLDVYAASWAETHRDACEATSVRGDQSEHVLDLRMACLRRAKLELNATAQVLLETDARGALRIHRLIEGLTPLSRCSDVDVLMAEVEPPRDPQTAEQVDRARAQLAAIKARRRAGAADTATELATLREEIEAIAYPPLHAEFYVQWGEAEHFASHTDVGREHLETGLRLTLANRQHDLAITVLEQLTLLTGTAQQAPEQGMIYAEVAQGLAARSGTDPRSVRTAVRSMGLALDALGRYDEALETFEGLLESVPADGKSERAYVLRDIARLLEIQGRESESERVYREVLEVHRELYGESHPTLADDWGNLGNALYQQARWEEAEAAHRRALELDRAVFEPGHIAFAKNHANLGAVLAAGGRHEEAAVEFRRVLELIGEDHPRAALVHTNLGSLALERQDWVEAERELRLALERHAATVGLEHPVTARPRSGLGLALDEQGRHEEAHELHREAVRIAVEAHPEGHSLVSKVRERLGSNLVSLGRPHEALEFLEQALAGREAEESVEPDTLASARFSLARGLWEAQVDRPRALELARKAAEDFAAVDERAAAAARRWVAKRRIK